MRQDIFGRMVLSEQDLCHAYLQNPERTIQRAYTDSTIKFDSDLELQNLPILEEFQELDLDIETFDRQQQSNYHMPNSYKELDIAEWVLDQCQTDWQRQRAGLELLLYLERDLFDLLRYLKYLVDTMRVNNIVWGVGRGSSVASYVLFLIGVHKIDSLYYDLDINEFLR